MVRTIFLLVCLVNMGCFAMNQKEPKVQIATTEGEITLKLFPEKAPVTVENFLTYVNDGFYNETIFHRVIEGFMIQGGGFTPDFDQKPTRKPIKNEADNNVKNRRGTIAMARTGEVDSATAQFFINTVDNDFLNFRGKNPHEYGYCAFGEVITGMDIIDKIEKAKTGIKEGHRDVPVKTVAILEAKQL